MYLDYILDYILLIYCCYLEAVAAAVFKLFAAAVELRCLMKGCLDILLTAWMCLQYPPRKLALCIEYKCQLG